MGRSRSDETEESKAARQHAFAAVFDEYRDRIRRYIHGMTRDPAEVDDLVQETFLRVHRKLETVRDPAALPAWLYRIATHVCYDRFRQASYRAGTKPLEAADQDAAQTPVEDTDAPPLNLQVEQAEMSTCVQEFIEQLSDDDRMVILLHDVHGLTNPEVARAVDCSLAAVKTRLHRARQRLKQALSGGCDFTRDERGVFVCDRKPSPPQP